MVKNSKTDYYLLSENSLSCI